jgi:hypothetical protein
MAKISFCQEEPWIIFHPKFTQRSLTLPDSMRLQKVFLTYAGNPEQLQGHLPLNPGQPSNPKQAAFLRITHPVLTHIGTLSPYARS